MSKYQRDALASGVVRDGTSCAVIHIASAGQHRVLDLLVARLVDVGDLAVRQPAREVERRDVAVAARACTAPGAVQPSARHGCFCTSTEAAR